MFSCYLNHIIILASVPALCAEEGVLHMIVPLALSRAGGVSCTIAPLALS